MESSTKRELKEQVSLLPLLPGCYIFSDKSGEIIYVGKAKSLKKRVSSYFVDSRDHSPKVRAMVRQIASLRYIIVDSETDALLLENSLIKSHKPRYNILLKDDKSYPWIALTPPPFERVISTRRVVKDGSRYFGPYASLSAQKSVLEFIAEVIPLRTCRHNLSQEMIDSGKYRVCLQYHIGNCKAPCCGKQSLTEYAELVNLTVSILKGDLRPVKNYLEGEMNRAAAELRFEAAHRFKMRLETLEKYRSKSVIVSANITDADIFSLYIEGEEAYCNFLRVKGGAIVAVQTLTIEQGVDATEEQMLTLGIQHFVDNIAGELQREVIVPLLPEVALFEGVTFTIPQRGEKRELLAFSQRTARLYRAELMKNMEIKNPERHADRIMEAMQRELRLDRQPRHIECFDNSNIQGTNPVSACVVFRDGVPSKNDYRHFKVKTVVGANDYATMKEVVNRRYSRMLEENPEDLPQLIVIDGGKGQLSFAYEALSELGLTDKLTVVALAERMEEVYRIGDPYPMFIDRNSPALKVLQQIRDEAHRFGITFHRKLRSKAQIESVLRSIPGVGDKTEQRLLLHFGSVTRLAAAPLEDIAALVGPVLAEKIKTHLSS